MAHITRLDSMMHSLGGPAVKTIRESFVLVSCLIVSLCAGAVEQNAANSLSNLPVAAKAGILAAVGRDIRDYSPIANSGGLPLKADDADALYPVVTDPWAQLAELTASDATDYCFLGISVAMSGDTVVVGADGEGGQSQGAAYVFVKPKSGWQTTSQFTAKLTPQNQQPNALFGGSVSISGSVIVVGAGNETVDYKQGQGAAYVFIKPKSGWKTTSKFTAKLTSSDGAASDSFGNSVSLAGSTLVIGAPYAAVNDNQAQGAAYVFIKPAGGWKTTTQSAKLTSSDGQPNDFFGTGVSVSGNTIAAGAWGHNQQEGEGYVFVKPASGWSNMSQTAKLSASNGHPGYNLGAAISIDGNTVVAGARFAVVHSQQQGAAYVFVEPNGGWKEAMTQTADLTASDGNVGDDFGLSVSINDNALAVGAWGVNRDQGAAYVFIKPQTGWRNTSKFAAKLTASNGAQNDDFGASVCVNGTTIIAGAPSVIVNQIEVGAAYVFGK
jgi:hypothetical protein